MKRKKSQFREDAIIKSFHFDLERILQQERMLMRCARWMRFDAWI